MPAKYKLTYFNAKGRAEISRYLFAYAKVEYEDIRIKESSWQEDKKRYPYEQLPVLQISNGEMMPHSMAIARYLAAEFDLYGSTNQDGFRVDVVVEAVADLTNQIAKTHNENKNDEAKKKEAVKKLEEKVIPFYLKRLDDFIQTNVAESGYFAGSRITLADILFFNLVFDVLAPTYKVDITPFDRAKKLVDKIRAVPAIDAWIQKRP